MKISYTGFLERKFRTYLLVSQEWIQLFAEYADPHYISLVLASQVSSDVQTKQ